MLLENKVAIVTGSSRGLGRASAMALAAEGCRVTLCARGADTLRESALAVGQSGNGPDGVLAVVADVSTAEGAEAVVRQTLDRFGRIDILVNNVGKAGGADLLATSDADWQSAIDQTLRQAEPSRDIQPRGFSWRTQAENVSWRESRIIKAHRAVEHRGRIRPVNLQREQVRRRQRDRADTTKMVQYRDAKRSALFRVSRPAELVQQDQGI